MINYYKLDELLLVDSHCNKKQISSIISNTKKYKKPIDLSNYIPTMNQNISDSFFEVITDVDNPFKL